MFQNTLFIIPARGGSKGIPNKNIKPFLGKPLIHYSIEYARQFVSDEFICLSTDDDQIIDCASAIGLAVPFVRPAHLASDTADTFGVLKHALAHYWSKGFRPDAIVLLQPTSPIRAYQHLEEAMALYNPSIEMVVSACQAHSSPYFNLFEENSAGFLEISKGGGAFARRQDAPVVYEYNGSIYIINSTVFEEKKSFGEVTKKVKYLMDNYYALDIDTPEDWDYAEYKYGQKR
jgi:N-acylneuraminate cytidylyltransferase